MSQTNPTEPNKLFAFEARTDAGAGAEALVVTVSNAGGEALTSALLIELQIPTDLVTAPVRAASDAAETSEEPPNMASLAGVVTVPAGWSVWAFNKGDEHVVTLRVFNNVNQETGEGGDAPTKLDAGAALTLRAPLKPEAVRAQFTILYGYQSASGDKTRVDGSLDLKPSHLPNFEPVVSLAASTHRNPTMIKPGEEVVISWEVENGVAATLRGPLPSGNSELRLSRDGASKFKIEEGSFTTVAVGPATYILDAEVKNPAGGPNVQVIRTLTLDIYSADKFASLIVRPDRVLPNGQVEIDWAVWGVKKASIWVGDRFDLTLELTQQNLFRTFQGTGTWVVHATASHGSETVGLSFMNAPKDKAWSKTTIDTVTWRKARTPSYEGAPLGMAFAEGTLALLTTDGLYTAEVGRDDRQPKEPVFARAQGEAKGWHRLTALGGQFVALRQAAGADLVVERYDTKGARIKSPVTLPGDFKAPEGLHGRFYNLVALGSRVYVLAGGTTPGGREVRRACSVSFDPDRVRDEPALAGLPRHRLLSVGDALYAFERQSGRMLRFDRAGDGGLEPPRRAAPAVNEEGESMIKTGTLVAVGTVLAVLNPGALPSFKPLALLGLENVLRAAMTQPRRAGGIPQDLVYNPQTDRWSRCGRGLEVEVGAAAAFRGGASKRLWVLQPGGELHTLAGAKEELFAPDYVDNLHASNLPPALDATRDFTFANNTGFDLVPMDEACRAAGLGAFEADGPAVLTPAPAAVPGQDSVPRAFKVVYDSTRTTNVKLRLMVAGSPGPRYFLEVTLRDSGLARAASVFKRLAADGGVAEIPGTAFDHPQDGKPLSPGPPRALHMTKRLLLLNATPRGLALSPGAGRDKVDESAPVDFSYATPDFEVSLSGSEKAGRLRVSFDYAMPMGVEVSSRREPQGKLIRVSTDDANLLDASAGHANLNSVIDFTFDRYDGRRSGPNPYTSVDAFWCRVGMRKKFELEGVRLGDAVSHAGVPALYFPMARPEDTSRPRVYRFALEDGELTALATNPSAPTRGGVFSVPNAVALDSAEVYAAFAEPVLNRTMHNGAIPWSRTNTDHYKELVALAAASSPVRAAFMLGTKKSGAWQAQPGRYFILADRYPNDVFEIPFDQARFGAAHGSLAAAPDGQTVAVCCERGFLSIDLASRRVTPVELPSATGPGHIVFSPDSQWVYCAHVTRVVAMNPRRTTAGRDITVTRARVGNPGERHAVALPNVEGDFGLTVNTRPTFSPEERPKEDVALSLAPSPDGRSLFVSAGTTIMKIALPDFTLQPWRATVELPCRLACVKEGWGAAWTLYALGSYYKGDGAQVDEYKTHLYAIPAPVN